MAGQPNMTDNFANSKAEVRRVLAPFPFPPDLEVFGADRAGESGPLFYLSWAGWELYLSRRLSFAADRANASPLLLPDVRTPEEDFAAIDQLVRTAGELGAGVLGLPGRVPESLPGLAGTIRDYHQGLPDKPGPVLDDRSYLALWAATEYQARQSERLLAEAAVKERSMWAALKGEESEAAEEGLDYGQAQEPDRRTVYAWRCWQRLAAPLLRESDLIVPNAPTVEED